MPSTIEELAENLLNELCDPKNGYGVFIRSENEDKATKTDDSLVVSKELVLKAIEKTLTKNNYETSQWRNDAWLGFKEQESDQLLRQLIKRINNARNQATLSSEDKNKQITEGTEKADSDEDDEPSDSENGEDDEDEFYPDSEPEEQAKDLKYSRGYDK